MDKETLYLVFPAILISFFIFIAVIFSLIFDISFLAIFLLSTVFTLCCLCGIYFYRKNKCILSDEEKIIENDITSGIRSVSLVLKEKGSVFYWKYLSEYQGYESAGKENISNHITQWNLEIIRHIEMEQFQNLCQQYLNLCGVKAEQVDSEEQGGVDLKIYKPSYSKEKPVAIALCRVTSNSEISVNILMELIGTMATAHVKTSFIFTNGHFSNEALQFAAKNKVIRLIDGENLLNKIEKLSEENKQYLLSRVTGNK